MTAQHTTADLRTSETLRRENRTLQWKAKNLGRQLGKAGQTIYELRCEIALLRGAVTYRPGDIARLLAQLRAAEARIERLQEKLATAEVAAKHA